MVRRVFFSLKRKPQGVETEIDFGPPPSAPSAVSERELPRRLHRMRGRCSYSKLAAAPSAIIGRDLWRYRELFAVLAWRDVSVRYKQTVIGVAWAFVRPLLTTIIFTVIFGRLAALPSDGAVPYPVLVLAGDAAMVPVLLDHRSGQRPRTAWSVTVTSISTGLFSAPASFRLRAGAVSARRLRDQPSYSCRYHALVWLFA